MFACFIQWTLPSIEKMKPAALLVAIIVLLASCSSTCELDYYENVSGNNLPDDIQIIECVDNAEYITTAALKIKASVVQQFLDHNQFEKVLPDFQPNFTGMYFLKKENIKFPPNDRLYSKFGRTKNNTWYFLIDKDTGKLWAEVMYPDWGGTGP